MGQVDICMIDCWLKSSEQYFNYFHEEEEFTKIKSVHKIKRSLLEL